MAHILIVVKHCMTFMYKHIGFYGALWLVASIIFASVGNSFVHYLGKGYSNLHIIFFKSIITFCILATIQLVRSPKRFMHSTQVCYQILRGAIGFTGVWFWVESLKSLPLSDASALSLTSALISAVGGYLIFKERVTWQKNIALLIGFLGVLIILKPRCACLGAYVLPLLSASAFAASALLAKHVMKRDGAITTTLYLTLTMGFISSVFSWGSVAASPLPHDVVPLILIGVCYAVSQVTFVKAYQLAEASFLAPLKFLKFPLHTLWGICFFFEIPSITTLLGVLFIVIGSSLLFYKGSSRTELK